MKVVIITIGDEILIGQIVDTNSAWMAQKLTGAGFEIEETCSIGDNAQQIKEAIARYWGQVDVVLLTGGLGPTRDDITKKTLCEYFNTELVFSDAVLENINEVRGNRFEMNVLTHDQAYVPKDCTIVQNRVGTAPVMWFERSGKILISMPGVPFEMKHVMTNEILPRLQTLYKVESYENKVFSVVGYSESQLAINLTDFENHLPQGFGLAYLPDLGVIRLRVSVRGEHRREELNAEAEKLRALLGKAIISETNAQENVAVEEVLGKLLLEKGLTIGTAESCTGGNIAHRITSIAGASVYFKGAIVSYANEIKENLLAVSHADLEGDGAVSESVVCQMAKGVCKTLAVDCSIAVSGIAGPGGGSEEKPVGTVWIATACKGRVTSKVYQMGKLREPNITRFSTIAILQLIDMF